ncbi:AfsR/SARP family transcriptional regulator [Streptomyces sp. IBSBF 2390]|uniref:AfsR/SARP family transcriptional regulator n=1 Tax=Streptomyces sp. IBSBF 2390 TaxID=2903533 RepID=UPI002FDBCF20
MTLVYFLLMLTPQPRFRLLGPLDVRLVGSDAVALTGRQRGLCALLLLHTGRAVSVERLAQGLWGERLPSASAARVRALVAEVRRALGPAGVGLLDTQKPGYVLRVAPSDVDVFVFEDMVREGARAAASGAWAEAYRCHDGAAALWQGDPLPDLPTMDAERRRLTELHIAALEGRAEADLELGRCAAAIAELVRLTSQHPLREHPHALLMRALQSDGRTSEALSVYTVLRRRMVDELGVDPSEKLEALHRRLLIGDSSAAATAGPPPTAQDRRVPRQLPRAPHRFIGRGAHLRQLDASRLSAEKIALIVGPAGGGKTALALHWAHRIASGFPDGQLFLDMRGFDAAEPMTVEEALPLLLQGLGSAPRDIPLGLEAQTALYRTLLAERQVLIVLDDVADAAVVRRLLPASSGSLTVVTSRHKLSGLVTLNGAHRVVCDVLDNLEALELLSTAVGPEGVAADPEASARLVELCDHLPLALCVAGSWVGDRPGSIAAYVQDLAERGRLARLHVEGEESVAVRSALDLSYESLPDEAKRMFRSLGLMAGTGRSIAAAAAGAGLDEFQTADLLGLAQRVHLLRDTEHGRPTWHDLVHEFARERVLGEESETERLAALDRILDHYLQSIVNAATACGMYVPHSRPAAVDGSAPRVFQAQGEAVEWFDGEWDDITAAIAHAAERGPARYAWQLVDALQDLLHHRRPLSEWIRLAHLARKAAEREGDTLGQAAACISMGGARWRDGDLRGALGEYEKGELLARRAGWLYGEAKCLQGRGVTLKLLGEPHKAPPYYDRTISIYRTLGMTRAEKMMLINMASLYGTLGRLAEAEEAVVQALALTDDAGAHVHAMALVNLALVLQEQARFDEAKDALRRSLLASRDSGSVYAEAVTLETLARVRSDAGQDARAIRAYEDALHLSQQVGNRNCQVDSLVGLACVKLRNADVDEAAGHLDTAREIAEETGHLAGLVEILFVQGALSCAVERHGEALTHLDRAASMAAEGNVLTLPRISTVAAVALVETGALDAASHAVDQAVEFAGRSGQRLVHAKALMARSAVHESSGDQSRARAAQVEAQALFAGIGTPAHLQTAAFWGTTPAPQHTSGVRRRPRPELPTDAQSRLEVHLSRHFDDVTAERFASS